MSKIPGLQLRRKTYYLRVRTPEDLLESYNSKEIIRSLRTRDYSEAARRIHLERVKIESEFQQRRKSKNENPDTLSEYNDYDFQGLSLLWLEEAEKRSRGIEAKNQTTYSEEEKQDHYKELQEHAGLAQAEAAGNSEDDCHYGMNAAAKFLDRLEIGYVRNSEAFRKLGNLFSMAIYERAQRDLRYWEGKPFLPTHPMFQMSSMQGNAKNSKIRKITFKQLAVEYMDDPSKGRVRSTKQNYRIVFRAIEELLGPTKYVSDITREDCKKLRDVLRSIPANARKKAPGKSLIESAKIAKEKSWPLISIATLNMHMSKLSAILDYAFKEGYAESNPCKGLSIRDTVRKSDKRHSFSIDDLQKIFSAPLYTGCVDDERKYNVPGNNKPRRARFWVPAISLFTGMRMEEICQLEISDITRKDKTDIILIRAESENGEEKRVKTEAGVRFVPVHPELKKIGFLKYVDEMKQREHKRVFPEIRQGSLGYYSNRYSKWFSAFLQNIKVKKPRISFHSFRHSYRDALREAEISQDAVRQLGGWSSRSTEDDYGQGLKPSTLYKQICKVKYEGLDLSHLYIE